MSSANNPSTKDMGKLSVFIKGLVVIFALNLLIDRGAQLFPVYSLAEISIYSIPCYCLLNYRHFGRVCWCQLCIYAPYGRLPIF